MKNNNKGKDYWCSCCLCPISKLKYLCDACAIKYQEDDMMMILTCGYAYYEEGTTLVSDDFFDKLCDKVLQYYDDMDSIYKHYLTKEMLETTSTFNAHYPRGAHSLYKYLTYKE